MSAERLNGSGNSSNDAGPGLAGSIDVVAGDRLPLVPRQIFKASLELAAAAQTTVALDFVATAGAAARGNENGRHSADGVFYLGPGRSPGYGVLNVGATTQVTSALTIFGRIANLLDRHYATAAQLGPTGFDSSGRFIAQPFPADGQGRFPLRNSTFYAPGAPRLFSLGLRYAFD
jgi:outer membrane receptor protein involved in Fe transport